MKMGGPRDDGGESTLEATPLATLTRWYADARARLGDRADVMALATATRDGVPSVRMVLLKQVDEQGLVFATNYDSAKGRDIATNPRAALALYWDELHRQVRIEGRAEFVSASDSDAIWESRPRTGRIAAMASRQSEPLASRADLDAAVEALGQRFEGVDVPRPERWGGVRVVPERYEFWLGRTDRLHDRFAFVRAADGTWGRARLFP